MQILMFLNVSGVYLETESFLEENMGEFLVISRVGM